jgi:serine/threonine-protein kinase
LRHIARALQDIHAERLIHRDLKPTNVLVAGPPGEEVAKVTDFGIVRVQDDPGTGVVAISVGYSAPEQYVPGNTQVGPQSDIFSFGALTFEVLTGCALFPQDSNTSLTAAQRSHRHSLLDAPTIDPSYAHAVTPVQAIDKLIAHATASSMDSRPSDVRELWRALDAQLAMIERVVAPTSEVQVGTSSTRSRMSSATMPAVRAEIIAGVAPPTAASQAGEGEGPWRWRLRGRDEGVDTVTDAALGEDGRALAVGAGGVRFWDGGAWLEIPLPDGISRDTFRAVARLDPDRYVMGGRDGVIAFLARGEWQVLRGNDKTIRYTALWGSEQGTLVAAGERPGRSAVVWCARDGVWLQAKKLIGVERVLGLATLGPDLVLAAGVAPSTNEPVTTDGNQGPGSGVKMRGTLHVVSTRTGNVEDITPEGAEIPALRAVAASRFGEMVAVGVDGFAARVTAPSEQRAILRRERVETERDLLGVRFDPMSQVWAVAAGRILVRAIGSDGRPVWRRVWWGAGEGPSLFRVYAAADRIVAFSREGLVIEGRSSVRATRSERPPKA